MSRFREWDLSCKVYVGNLGSSASKYEIERVFCKYGPIRNVWVARNPPGFAFVEFEDSRDAEDSVRGLDGTLVSIFLNLKFARSLDPFWSIQQNAWVISVPDHDTSDVRLPRHFVCLHTITYATGLSVNGEHFRHFVSYVSILYCICMICRRCCGTRIRVEMSSGRTRRDVGRRYNFSRSLLALECFESFTFQKKYDYSSVSKMVTSHSATYNYFIFVFMYYLALIFPYRANQLFSEHSFMIIIDDIQNK